MVIVLVSVHYKRLFDYMKNIENTQIHSVEIMKQIGPKAFIYVDTDLSFNQVKHLMRAEIKKNGGGVLVFEIYPLFNGMTDIYSYLPESKKMESRYYTMPHKECSNEEIQKYLQQHTK